MAADAGFDLLQDKAEARMVTLSLVGDPVVLLY